MTEILMMTLTPQLRKIAIKKRAYHPSSIREPDLDFRKLVDKLEQAEITMKLEETENLKLQYVNRIETNTTNINNIQESDTDLVEKITEILNIYEKHPNFKGKPSFKKWCNYCPRYGHSISECRQKQQDNQNKPQKYKEPNKSFYQYMKKDQNLPNKSVYSNNSSGKPLPNNTNYTRTQSPYNSSYRGRSPERRNTQNSSQNHYNRPNSRNNYSRSNSNTTRFVSRSNSQSRNNYYPHNQSRNSSYNRNRNYSNNRNRSYSNNRNQNYPNNRSRNNSYNRSNYNRPNNNYQNRSQNNSQNRHSSYNNRYRNYSKSPHRNNNHYNISNNRHRSSTPKHQRNIIQVQTNPETTSDPPGIDDTGNNELQLNQINCESSDSESDTENTISINMIAVENDYEPIIYAQPFSSHIYENQLELLHNYYIEPIQSTQTAQETNEINTTNQSNENAKTKCLNTNHIYQNIQKEQPKEKIWTIPFLLERPRNKEFQPPDLEIDFLIDSGAESNIINIPTWNEIKSLHPKLTPLETSSKLATAQGSTLVNYGKIQLFLLPTRTIEQNKILNKPFKQIFHITDIKHNIIGIPFISKYIPTINILNSKILIKDKYTKTKDTSLTFFQRLNKQPPFFSKFYPIYNQQRKHLKPLSGNIYNFSIKQVHQNDKKQNKQQLYMSDFEFKPIHKFFKITISSIKYLKNSNSDIISLHVYNNTPYQVTLPLELLGYCETNATISPIHEKAYRVNNILQLLDICQSTILNEELSINNIISNEKRNTDYFTKTPYFKPTFNINNYTENQQKFLTMFNFQHSQITQDEFDKLAKQHFFLTRVKFLGHNIERKTITPLKSRIDAIQKLHPPTNKKKIQEFLGMLNFLSKYVYKMQLYLRPFYNILRQQNNFEWNTEHQAQFEEIKKLLTEQISNTIPDPNQPFYAMCDASNFGIGAALLQSHNGTNKMNLISANSRLFTQAELRLSTLMRECTAIIYTITEYEFLILGSKHPTVLFTDHKPIIFLFTQKSNPNHRVYRFQLILMKFPNLHIVWTAGKNLALPDTLSRNTPPELLTRKTTVEIPKNIKFYLAENETSPRLECKYAVKTDVEQSQINNLQHFPLYLDCQNNHYEFDLLGTSTFKPIPYSQ